MSEASGVRAVKTKFRTRLRVRLAKPLTTTEKSYVFVVGGKNVILGSQDRAGTLEGATWVVFRAGGFETEKEAQEFGQHLKSIVDFAGVCDRLGFDVGQDRATSVFTQAGIEAIIPTLPGTSENDRYWGANIHGLMVMPDDEHNRILQVNIEAKVTADPKQFYGCIAELGENWPPVKPTVTKGLWLLNQALLTSESVAQIVLAIAAVEEMGQDEKWSPNQLQIIERLQAQVMDSADLGEERLEVASALKSIFKLSLRQGVLRLLVRVGLPHLKTEWDAIYGERSALVHGTAGITDRQLEELATKTVSICGAIVLATAQLDGCKIPAAARLHFPAIPAPIEN